MIDIIYAKGKYRDPARTEYSRWNSISRVEVDQRADGSKWIVIDADAATRLMDVDPHHLTPEMLQLLKGAFFPSPPTLSRCRETIFPAEFLVSFTISLPRKTVVCFLGATLRRSASASSFDGICPSFILPRAKGNKCDGILVSSSMT